MTIYPINHHVFDTITEESAYWIGFLMADGNVTRNRNNMNVNLKIKDLEHLKKLEVFLNIINKTKIYTYQNYTSCKLDFNSKKIKQRLSEFGIVPNKSLTAKVSPELEFNRHFWRGVIDGDGCIGKYYKNKIWCISLVGSLNLTNQFSIFVKTLVETNAEIYKDKNGNYYHFGIKNQPAEKLIKHLYSDCNTFLERKMEISKRCILENEI